MATVVDICNLALARLGDRANVTSIDPPEGSVQSDHCARFYPMARDTALAAHDWSFASTYGTLAEIAVTNPEWLYTYALPSTAITVRKVGYTQDQLFGWTDGPYFELASLDTGALTLLSNVPDLGYCRFTRRVTDPTKFPPLFTEALVFLLASYLAGPVIKGKAGAQTSATMYQAYIGTIRQADTIDANQSRTRPRYTPSSARLRGFSIESTTTVEFDNGQRAELPFWAA